VVRVCRWWEGWKTCGGGGSMRARKATGGQGIARVLASTTRRQHQPRAPHTQPPPEMRLRLPLPPAPLPPPPACRHPGRRDGAGQDGAVRRHGW
jgi:hypothetical protein